MTEFNDSLPLLLDIKNDFVFKQVFGIEKNKNVLMSFLNAILKGNPKIIDLELLNTDSPKLIKNGLGIRLDVKAKVSDNTFVDIEIQCRNTHDIPERAIQYLARMLNENADKDNKNELTRDYHYPKVIGIWILGQNVTDRASAISEASMVFHKNDRDDYRIMSDKMRVFFIELKKFKPKTIDKKNMLNIWLSFLQNPENQELKHVDETVDQAFDTLKFVSSDKKMRDYYITLEETKRDIDSERINSIRIATEKGREEGIAIGEERGREEGIEQKTQEAALNMKADGLPNSIIAKYLGITEKELENILNG